MIMQTDTIATETKQKISAVFLGQWEIQNECELLSSAVINKHNSITGLITEIKKNIHHTEKNKT